MAIGDVYRFAWKWTDAVSNSEVLTSGFHVRQDGASHDFNAIAVLMRDMWTTGLGGSGAVNTLCTSDIVLQSIVGRRVRPLEPVEQSFTTGLPSAGTEAAGQTYSPQDAMLVSLRTASIGRKYRGRMYFPPPAEADAAGTIALASAQLLADAVEGLRDALDAVGLLEPMVIMSDVPPGTGPVTVVTQVKVDRSIRSQRRRQKKERSYIVGV